MKQFILVIFILLYFPTEISTACHPAFGSWRDYHFFFRMVQYHGISSASREIKGGKVWWEWKDNKGHIIRRIGE